MKIKDCFLYLAMTFVGMTGLTSSDLTVGNSNVVLGDSMSFTSSNLSGNANIIIGPYQAPAVAGGSNTLNIGGVLYGSGVNQGANGSNGNIGINVAQPNSALQVGGSVSTPARTISTTPTLGATDYTVIVTSGGVNLEAASATAGTGNLGRIYRIINKSGTQITINNVRALASTATNVSVVNNAAVTVQCVDTSGGPGTSAAWYRVQ